MQNEHWKKREIIVKDFVKFLKERNIYAEFRARFHRTKQPLGDLYFYDPKRHPSLFINGAFIWPMGSNWFEYSAEWRGICVSKGYFYN